ncbi:hypothetical protein XM53_16455 [Roseovarius atlanticus]|uniref:Uncharacterized protein n=1 Tax=Roseovarius atlanticus TaxID=1641875 RepID=A0A0T5NS29_9RHOB|nr:hypothetical protein XM53_16455 [Roseovarius atlanticus]
MAELERHPFLFIRADDRKTAQLSLRLVFYPILRLLRGDRRCNNWLVIYAAEPEIWCPFGPKKRSGLFDFYYEWTADLWFYLFSKSETSLYWKLA